MISDERITAIEQAARLYGPANCWTGTSGTLAAMIIELLNERETMNMGRDLLTNDLTPDNIDNAKVSKQVDLVDTLRRIGREWLSISPGCGCDSNEGCSICEIHYLLEEAFEPND